MIALHGRQPNQRSHAAIKRLLDELNESWTLKLSPSLYNSLRKLDWDLYGYEIYENPSQLLGTKMLISLGGDGTILEATTHVGPLQIPILGLNLGRLGFLSSASIEEIKSLPAIIKDQRYTVQKRAMIRLSTGQDLFDGLGFALNEFAVTKKDTSSMITVKAFVDGEYLNSYWADGLIVATPTGSSGYSLSCGGPLVGPQSQNFILTPVSPHNLTVRPMVLSDSSTIDLEVEGRDKNILLSLDGRSRTVEAKFKISLKREKFDAHLVNLEGYSFFETLRQKLHWGADFRN